MNEEIIKEKIIETLKSFGGKKFRRRELYNLLGVKYLDYDAFKNTLSLLEKSGIVLRKKGRKFVLPDTRKMVTGIFAASRNGGGQVILPDGESVIVKRVNVGDALPGDTVQINIKMKRKTDFLRTAKIIKVIERSTKPVVGIYKKHGETSYIIPQKDGFANNLLVKNSGEFDVADGHLVICRMEIPFAGYSNPMCVLTEVLGDPDSPGIDILAIARRYELPIFFPEEVLKESENIPDDLGQDVLENRRDIRDIVTFTIDPEDAKDFDDAISISRTDNDGFELGIHIADVSHYVRDGSAMDNEARARGMSCYLVDRVIPMLPERLSNGLCSLKPHEDRLTKSVFATLDKKGNIIGSETVNTFINSNMRLTYRHVQDYLDGKRSDGAGEITPEVGEALKTFSELTDILIERRNERGALDMELPEARVILDEENKPVNIIKRDRNKAHRMIEEAMLLANTITAEVLAKTKAPFLYRIHDKPEDKKLTAFGEIANTLGYKFKSSKIGDQKYIQSFLMFIKGKRHEKILNMFLLRSMKKAGYSPKNIGHYGLAIKKYSHFTSPIRRYPDLVAHRQLDTYVFGNGDIHEDHDLSYYESLGDSVTQREIVSDSAERDSIKMKSAEFMKGHLGEEFEGTVTGIIPIGIFVKLDTYFVEGLVHVSSLHDDYYDVDSTGTTLVGMRNGRRFTIGDRLNVAVASADKERGEINFMLIEKVKKKKNSKIK